MPAETLAGLMGLAGAVVGYVVSTRAAIRQRRKTVHEAERTHLLGLAEAAANEVIRLSCELQDHWVTTGGPEGAAPAREGPTMAHPVLLRVVIEVDGVQHYGIPNPPDKEGRVTRTAMPRLYAKRVAEDRRLRLAGYATYRFGGWGLSRPHAWQLVQDFFTKLLVRHQKPASQADALAFEW
ncbi:hypothetical protein [Streptomyces sp. NPDC096012]|uniref:hypothetical protein n=1 Tax=Streptomyces sp. NPDC096012 TaxID=3155684 RepID=UPI00336A39E6